MSDGPRRTCIQCRQVRDRSCLVRLVCRPDGEVVVDGARRLPGRGAYVCGGPGCVARLGRGGRLTQAFRRACRPTADLVAAVVAASVGVGADAGSPGATNMTNSTNLMSAR